MNNTYLEYFNFYLKEYLNELISHFPQLKQPILENYRNLLEDKETKSDLYVKYYMSRVNDYLTQIAKRDETLFEREHLYLLEGINFNLLWHSSDNKPKNKKATWKYLQLLTLLGRQIIPNQSNILNMLKKVGTDIEEIEKIDNTLNNEDSSVDETIAEGPLANIMNLTGGLMGGNSDIGMMTDLAKGVSEVMKNIDIEEISKNMMEGLNNIPETSQDSETSSNNNVEINDGEGQDSESASATAAESGNQSATSGNQGDNLFNNGLFKDLAEEMSNTFDFENLNQNVDANNANVGEVFKNFMSGDNPSKLMNLVGKFGNRLQKDLSTGKINQEDLLRQTQQMMGGNGMADLHKQMSEANLSRAQQNRVRSNTRNQSARDRLKAKYEKRQAEQNQK